MAAPAGVNDELFDGEFWAEAARNMQGFPFPAVSRCREESVVRADGLGLARVLVVGNGKAYGYERDLERSLFGRVIHGVQLEYSDPNDASTFRVPTRREDVFHVAIKKSNLDEMRRTPHENIFREIAVMQHLSNGPTHPSQQYVMPLVAACISKTALYVLTPYCGGGDLLGRVTPDEGMEERKARTWFRQILRGVGYIHSRGLCHHDLSPENIVITADDQAAVVMDFGMAQRIHTGKEGEAVLVRDSEPFGKCRYMAPEIYRHEEYDGRQTDIWSVGASLLVCLWGRYPWEAPTRSPAGSRRGRGALFSSDIYRFGILEEFGMFELLRREGLSARLSPEVIDLLCEMVQIDRGLRPHSADALTQNLFFSR